MSYVPPKETHKEGEPTAGEPTAGESSPNLSNTGAKPKQYWRELDLQDRLIILLTGGILAVAVLTAYIFLRQANLMENQLGEMQGSGSQTERIIMLSQGQLTQYAKQVQGISSLVEQEKRYATAAERSLSIAKNSDRPWIGPVTAAVEGKIAPDGGVAHLVIINSGRTPARILKFRGAQANFDKFPANPPFPNTTFFPENSHHIIVPNSLNEVVFPYSLPVSEHQQIVGRTRRFYIYGIVEYQRIGDTKTTYTTKVCYFWTLTEKNVFAACQEYNDAN